MGNAGQEIRSSASTTNVFCPCRICKQLFYTRALENIMGNNPVISIISQYRESSIAKLLNWHRQSGLTKMAEHLNQLKSRYQNGLKGEDIEWIRAEQKIFWERVLNRAEPDLVSFLFTVTENQVRQMERKLIERNDWLVKQVKMTPKEAHASTNGPSPNWRTAKNPRPIWPNSCALTKIYQKTCIPGFINRKPTGPKPLKTGSKIRRRSGKKLF